MGYIVGPLISVPAQNSATWTQRTADISAYIGQNVRLVVLYQSGSSFTGDVQLDDFNIGGNTFDPETGTHNFQVQSVEDNSQLSNVNYIQSDYDSVTWSSLTTDGSTHALGKYGKFFRDSGGTPSGSTGNTSGNTGSFYYFAETSSTGSNNDIWIRSPEVTVNNGTLSFYTAQNGATSGPIYAYIEVTSVPAKAVYGLGRYGDSNYGKLPETVRAPLSVIKAGSIYGQQNYGGTTYGSGSISTTHSGISATGSVTTVTVTADSSVTLPSVSATGSVTTVTVSADSNLSITAPAPARGSPDLAGALHSEWWLPDMGNYNVVVTGFDGATEVFADGVSIGTTSGSGNTLTITQSQYASKLITTDKPADFSYSDGRANAIPTSWQGTEFITRSTRYGSHYKIWSISGTATVQIYKDSTLDTTATVTNGTQYNKSYADDTSDPEYRIKSDVPILVFESGVSTGGSDSNPLFPSTSDDLYGVGSNTTYFFRDEGYGGAGVNVVEYRSDGTTETKSVSTAGSFAGASGDFKPPASRLVSSVRGGAESLADNDGGESTRFVPAGAMAHEFILGEQSEFVGFVGEPGTVGRYIRVFNSSGTLIDTVQLGGDGGANFPSYIQIVSATTVDSALTGIAKSYNLDAGVKFVSEVPVMGIQEDQSSNDEHNFFGLRHFGGLASGEAGVVLPSVSATGTVNDSLTFTGDSTLTTPSVSATATPDADLVIEADARHTVTSVQGVSGVTSVGTVGVAIHEVTGVEGVGRVTSSTVSGDNNTVPSGVSGTGQNTTVTISGDSNVSVLRTTGTGQVTTVTISADNVNTVPSVSATGSVTTVGVSIPKTVVVPSVTATGSTTTVTIFTGEQEFVDLPSVEATGTVNTGDNIVATLVDVVVPSVSATGAVNDSLTFVAEANLTLASVQATGVIDDLTFVAEANTTSPSVQATATVDPDVVIEGDALHVITSVQGVTATGGVGDVVAGADIDTLTGVEATGQVATATTSGSANTTPDSTQGTGQTSTVTISGVANFALSGVEATTSVDTVDIALPRVVALDSVSTTASVDTATVSADSNLASSSVSATATVDPDVVIEGDALHVITSVQGVSASGGIGDVVAEANLDTITGVEATGSIGTVEVAAPRDVAVSGVQATGNVTTVTVTADNVVVVDFVTGTLSNTVPTISGDANFELPSASLTATVTTPVVSADSNTSVTSVSATTAVNSTTTSAVIFDYNAQKNNYSKKRTVYLPRVA